MVNHASFNSASGQFRARGAAVENTLLTIFYLTLYKTKSQLVDDCNDGETALFLLLLLLLLFYKPSVSHSASCCDCGQVGQLLSMLMGLG